MHADRKFGGPQRGPCQRPRQKPALDIAGSMIRGSSATSGRCWQFGTALRGALCSNADISSRRSAG